MKALRNASAVLACASLLLGQLGCSTTATLLSSTKFSQSAYDTDKNLKTESLALIDRAKDKAPYTGVAADVDQLMKKVDAAIAAEQARTKNLPTVEQWKKVKAQLSDLFPAAAYNEVVPMAVFGAAAVIVVIATRGRLGFKGSTA